MSHQGADCKTLGQSFALFRGEEVRLFISLQEAPCDMLRDLLKKKKQQQQQKQNTPRNAEWRSIDSYFPVNELLKPFITFRCVVTLVISFRRFALSSFFVLRPTASLFLNFFFLSKQQSTASAKLSLPPLGLFYVVLKMLRYCSFLLYPRRYLNACEVRKT